MLEQQIESQHEFMEQAIQHPTECMILEVVMLLRKTMLVYQQIKTGISFIMEIHGTLMTDELKIIIYS